MRDAACAMRPGVHDLSDAGWLALAVASGVLIAAAWVSRERAIHRRRRQRFTGEEKRE